MKVAEHINEFLPTSLKEMDGVKLLSRSDTKFAFSINILKDLINRLTPFYNVLEIDGKRKHDYKSLYFDTEDRKFYNDHHNQRVNRHKVRYREYVDSGLVFLEIKCKNNKGKTIKKRLKVDKIHDSITSDHQNYVDKIIGSSLKIKSTQWINFSRITLVHKKAKERLTIDLNLNFHNNQNSGNLNKIIIAEVKQERMKRSSDFIRIAKEMNIHPMRISKYCFSSFNLDNSLKQNRFKEKQIFINKIINIYTVLMSIFKKIDILWNFLYKICALIYLNCERFKKTAKKVFFSQFKHAFNYE